MTRMSALALRPMRILAALGLFLAASSIAAGSGANFTAGSANPNVTFTAGTVAMSNSGGVILSAANMRPGDSTVGTVEVANTGTLAATFELRRSALTSAPASPALAEKIDLVVKDCGAYVGATPPTCEAGDPARYTGTLAAFSSVAALGGYAIGDKRVYEFRATLDASAPSAYQGGSSTAEFEWTASS